MKKDELISIIENELKNNPHVTSTEITKKHKIPWHAVEVFRKMIVNGQMKG